MEEAHPWYGITESQQADMIEHISFNLSMGDDMNMGLSNISREAFDAVGIDYVKVGMVMDSIAKKWRESIK